MRRGWKVRRKGHGNGETLPKVAEQENNGRGVAGDEGGVVGGRTGEVFSQVKPYMIPLFIPVLCCNRLFPLLIFYAGGLDEKPIYWMEGGNGELFLSPLQRDEPQVGEKQ